jgi:hypothetical protein
MRHTKWLSSLGVAALTCALATSAQAITTDPAIIQASADIDQPGAIEHCDDVVPGRVFADVFDCGDELFSAPFNAVDGAGGNVGDGGRFTRVPRTDQNGPTEWANHRPMRATGPNSNTCSSCHGVPFEDGAGGAVANNVRDPKRTNDPGQFIQRNPPHIFGMGGVQLIAEELTRDLLAIRAQAIVDARAQNRTVTVQLTSHGISFGTLAAMANGTVVPNVQGVDADLVVKPFDWKGVVPTVRAFVRDASHQELGMNPVETAGDNVDGDFDGVVNEMLIEDITALAVYQAAQPRPVTRTELNALRNNLNGRGAAGRALAVSLGLPTVSAAEANSVTAGGQQFNAIGCNVCHIPQLTVPRIFTEPSQVAAYRETTFPAGQNAVQRGLNPANPIRFDTTADQPDNVITLNGVVVARLGSFQRNGNNAVIRLFGDLKRHNMGPQLAENIDSDGTGAATFITENLWGVASTPQYLHDGRSTSIIGAIVEHGGEAQASRDAFSALPIASQRDVVNFLKNQVLFKILREGDAD